MGYGVWGITGEFPYIYIYIYIYLYIYIYIYAEKPGEY